MLLLTNIAAFGTIICFVVLTASLVMLLVPRWRSRGKPVAGISGAGLLAAFVILVVAANNSPKPSVATNEQSPKNLNAPSPPTAQTISPKQAETTKPGRLKICIIDEDFTFDGVREVVIPATALFEASSRRVRVKGDPKQREPQSETGLPHAGMLITAMPVTLTKTRPCAEAEVRLYRRPTYTETSPALADDKRLYDLNGVAEYPIPQKKPAVELGKLIDDVILGAALLEDATEEVRGAALLDQVNAPARCFQGALALASHLGTKTLRQTSMIVGIESTEPNSSISYGCGDPFVVAPDVKIAWDNRAKPSAAITSLIGKAGEFLTGARADEIKQELNACLDTALKPQGKELAEREFRGVKIECQSFYRDGGAGIATIYRRFGAPPPHIAKLATVSSSPAPAPERTMDPDACRSDWTKCETNGDVVKNHKAMITARNECKDAAERQARFGSPEWPWFAFRSFRPGDDAPKKGVVTLIEPEAKFSNQFGAMARVIVSCTYSLRENMVLNVNIKEM